MIVNQPVSITLPASDWLQIAGWMMAIHKPGVANHLLDEIGRTVLKED
jgi:hypothetical protein